MDGKDPLNPRVISAWEQVNKWTQVEGSEWVIWLVLTWLSPVCPGVCCVCSCYTAFNLNFDDWWMKWPRNSQKKKKKKGKETEPLGVLRCSYPPWRSAVGKGLFFLYDSRGILSRACQGIRAETEPQGDKHQDFSSPVVSVGPEFLVQDPWRNIINHLLNSEGTAGLLVWDVRAELAVLKVNI